MKRDHMLVPLRRLPLVAPGQTTLPTPNAIGFKHDPDEAYEKLVGPEKAAEQRIAYREARRCTCSSGWPEKWGARNGHKPPCPRAGKRF